MAPCRRACRHLAGLLLLICATSALRCPERSGPPGRELLCYTQSSDAKLLENGFCQCTTLVHQGHDLRSLNASAVKSLRDSAKEANPELRFVLSVNDEKEILSSNKTRQEAGSDLVNLLKEVDGVELNVTAGSKARLVSFIKGLKDEAVNTSMDKMILLALPTKPEELAKQFELKELSKYVDLFTVATHYLRDTDEAYRAFHPSRLMGLFDMLNTDSLVDLITGLGVPKQKIVISAPTSAYSFTLKKAEDNTPRSETLEELPVAIDRKKLCDEMDDGEWTVERDEDLTAPYAFKNNKWIAFEDETSLKIKGKYVILRELAGLGLQGVEFDLKNECGMSVTESVYRAFEEMKRKTREVVLSSLEKDLKGTDIAYPRHVRSSDYRIVRVVDTEGKIRAVRENTQTAFTCARQGYFVHPKSCNRFYRCVKFNQEIDDYSVFEFDCPAGLAFDERAEVCVWPGSLSSGSACPGSSEIEPVPRSRFRCPNQPGFYADPQNCRWFFACYDLGGPEMVPYEFRCPFGLVFDEQRLICEWPWKVPNCNGPGHAEDHHIYNYGGTYGGQGNAHGAIEEQGGFIGEGGYAAQGGGSGYGISYGAGSYQGHDFGAVKDSGTSAGHGAHSFVAGTSGVGYDGHNINIVGVAGGAGYENKFNVVSGAGTGIAYEGPTYNTAGGVAYQGQSHTINQNAGVGIDHGQSYHPGGTILVETVHDGHAYNAGGSTGAATDYDEQTYVTTGVNKNGVGIKRPTDNTGISLGIENSHDGQTYNAGGISGPVTGNGGQTHAIGGVSGVEIGYNGQMYNSAGAAGVGVNYDGQSPTYNSAGAAGVGVNYNGQSPTYNSAGAAGVGVNYDGQSPTYNSAGAAGVGVNYDGQSPTYNSAGAVEVGVNYDGQSPTYNSAGAAGVGYGGQSPNFPESAGVDYDGQNYNDGGTIGAGIDYDGKNVYSTGDCGPGASLNGQQNAGATGVGCDGQVFIQPGVIDVNGADVGREVVNNNNGFDGQNVNIGSVDSNKGIITNSADYDDRGGVTATGGIGQSAIYNTGNIKTTQFSSEGAGSTIGVNNFAGDSRVPTGFTTASPVDFTSGVGSTTRYPTGAPTEFTTVNPIDFAKGASSTTGYSGGAVTGFTTVSPINFAGSTGAPTGYPSSTVTGFTTASPVDFASGVPSTNGYTAGTTTGYSADITNGYTGGVVSNYAADRYKGYTGGVTVGTAGSTGLNNLAVKGGLSSGVPNERYSTNFGGTTAGVGNSAQTGLFGDVNTGSTTGGQSNSVFDVGSVQYGGITGPILYNSTYGASPGYPPSTIIPFVPKDNTVNTVDYSGTGPVNSMGLTSTEYFGKEYTNQAEKSFATQRPGFIFNGRTKNFYTGMNAYDNSKVNLAGITPSITLVRDGVYNTGGTFFDSSRTPAGTTNFRNPAISTVNFNGGIDVTNAYGNSPLMGSSITSTNNDITKLPEITVSPNNFRFDGTTSGNTVFRTDSNSDFFFNQKTTGRQNGYTGTPVATVIPLTTPRPAVELDNSGLFGTNFVDSTTPSSTGVNSINPSTTPQTIGYKTNEYYDNGGRGTIRYNNGVVTNKVSETDIQDYRTSSSYTRIPNSFIINAGNGENPQSTIQKTGTTDNQQFTEGTFTRGGFTKTGPTKTGITTAQVGGSGSYVIGTGTPRMRPNPQHIGENAFAGNFGTAPSPTNPQLIGEQNFANNFRFTGTTANSEHVTQRPFTAKINGGAETANYDARDNAASYGTVGTISNFGTNSGSGTVSGTTGYSYPKPIVQLEIKGISTTPRTSTTLIDASTPSLSNFQPLSNQNSIIVESNGNDKSFSSTISPIGFTTGQLENFKTTVFQAAKLPQSVSTVQPVVDTGFNTVISSTPIPIVTSTQRPIYQKDTFSTTPRTYLDFGASFDQGNDYTSTAQGSSGNFEYSDITANVAPSTYGQKIAGQSKYGNIDYQPTTVASRENNNILITSTHGDFNSYVQSGLDGGIQSAQQQTNYATGFGPTVTIPKQVHLQSSTIAPEVGVTFSKPVVTAEFSEALHTVNGLNSGSQGFNNRVLSNPFLSNQPFNRISGNQGSANFATQGSSNRVLSNQASLNYANNLGSANFASRGTVDTSGNFGTRVITNGILGNEYSIYHSGQNQGSSGQTRTLIGSNVVTSIGAENINEDVIRQNSGNPDNIRIVAEFDGRNDGKLNTVQSTTTAPEVTTYGGDFTRTRGRFESSAVYNKQDHNRKVIVKLSDLHPLILGKLGAECTCKADPFAVFRSPSRPSLPINSENLGPVDLSNYDESDIYVDVDSDRENEREIALVQNIPSHKLIKTSGARLTDYENNNRGIVVSSRGEPSSTTFLPTTTASTTTTYLPPSRPSNVFLPSSTVTPFIPVLTQNQAVLDTRTQKPQPLLIRVEDNNTNRASFETGRSRSGKTLFDGANGSPNDFREDASFDRYGPGGLRDNVETLQAGFDCARPGLFRHPKYCNKFYACHWDQWKKRFTLHVFNCPVHLAFDSSAGACNYPSKGPACQDNQLLI